MTYGIMPVSGGKSADMGGGTAEWRAQAMPVHPRQEGNSLKLLILPLLAALALVMFFAHLVQFAPVRPLGGGFVHRSRPPRQRD